MAAMKNCIVIKQLKSVLMCDDFFSSGANHVINFNFRNKPFSSYQKSHRQHQEEVEEKSTKNSDDNGKKSWIFLIGCYAGL